MQKITSSDSESKSHEILATNIEELRTLFPDVFVDGAIDFDALKQLLGGAIDEREEKYGLSWHGKRKARQLALTPSAGTLRPIIAESVDWDTTKHLMIEGDNLEALKLLQKSYTNKVKLINIDPPYNTGQDFVYPDDFRESIKNYLAITGQADGGEKLSANTETSGRFHTDWLNMMLPRLRLARSLLRQDGVIFITIDDNEVHRLRMLLDEVFGEENFVAQVEWQKRYTRSNNTDDFTSVIDHICIYQKSDAFKVKLLARDEAANARFTNIDNDPRGPWKATPFLNQVSPDRRPNLCYPIRNPKTGKVTMPDKKAWRYERSAFERLLEDDRLYWGKDGTRDVPDIKTFLSEVREGMTPINFWSHQYASHTDQANREIKEIFGEKVFDTPKPILLVQRMLEHGTEADDIVMDFFAGTGTTGHAVMRQNSIDGRNRRYILVQLPEPLNPADPTQKVAADLCDKINRPRTLAELTKERLRRAAVAIRNENPLFTGDLGFRSFRLDTSNINAWQPSVDNLEQSLLAAVEHVKAGRSEQDVLFEILLKLGLDLSVTVERKTVATKDVYSIGAGVLFTCLSERITVGDVEGLALGIVEWHKLLSPAGDSLLVFRDSAFENDVAKTNLTAILVQNNLINVRSL